jgi:hypothetical protein
MTDVRRLAGTRVEEIRIGRTSQATAKEYSRDGALGYANSKWPADCQVIPQFARSHLDQRIFWRWHGRSIAT